MKSIAQKIIKKDIKAAARLMHQIESEDLIATGELKTLQEHTGGSHIIGITGLPGSGKSTIIDVLIKHFRKNDKSVGVIAIDPSSPFSGGSLMGDRIRMKDHNLNGGVFIKSLPTRGWHGGISKVTSRMITVMDAMGKDIILVETAGVGQTEVDIKNLVHTTIVVLVGGLGDHIQVIKAGIIEIADIFIINKVKGNNSAKDLELDLKSLFNLNGVEKRSWTPPVFLTEATDNMGIEALAGGIENHRKYLKKSGQYERYFENKKKRDLKQMVEDYIIEEVKARLNDKKVYKKLLDGISSIVDEDKLIKEKILKDFFK